MFARILGSLKNSLCWNFHNFQSLKSYSLVGPCKGGLKMVLKSCIKLLCILLQNRLLKELIFSHDDLDGELSELKNEAVPDDVRKWLASTFTKPEQVKKGL